MRQVTPDLLRDWPLPEPTEGDSKHDRGTVLVVGGSAATPGAVLLAGVAALRVGAGRLQVATTSETAAALAVALPEAMVVGYAEAARLAEGAAAVVLGPGVRTRDEAADLLARVLPSAAGPVVVDAVALSVLEPGQVRGPVVLTPNDGELAALAGDDDVGGDPSLVAAVAARYDATVVHRSAVVAPDGEAWVDRAGGVELATSGSGDVLAGAVGGLLARGADPAQAAVWGAHLHAAAGARLRDRYGSVSGLLARELLDELPVVLGDLAHP
jgi:ADP-dependent NAD(P)H-hydrate dehydratase